MNSAILDRPLIDESWVQQAQTHGEGDLAALLERIEQPERRTHTPVRLPAPVTAIRVGTVSELEWWRTPGISTPMFSTGTPGTGFSYQAQRELNRELVAIFDSIAGLAELRKYRPGLDEVRRVLTRLFDPVEDIPSASAPRLWPDTVWHTEEGNQTTAQMPRANPSKPMQHAGRRGEHGLMHDTLSEDEALVATADNPVAAADNLRLWLGLTYDELESITSIAKNTFHHWHRTGATPRPSTVRKLLRAYALTRAVMQQLGHQGAVDWFRAGPHSPLGAMLNGDLAAAEHAAHALLFSQATRDHDHRIGYSPFAPDPEFDVQSPADSLPLRRASRSPRRGRLSEQ